jgi:hypothetical protein
LPFATFCEKKKKKKKKKKRAALEEPPSAKKHTNTYDKFGCESHMSGKAASQLQAANRENS